MPTPARVVVQPPGAVPLRVEEAVLPDPGPHQVVIRQFASGVCHSQLHQIHNTARQNPIVLGHESTGVVIAKGAEVSTLDDGDHVLVTWVPKSPEAAGRMPERAVLKLSDGSELRAGTFTWADHTISDEAYVVRIPKDARTDVTSIIACAVMTGAGAVINTAGVKAGQSVAVFGVGGVGLPAIAAARVVGADPIIAVDLEDSKLEMARRFGATHGVNASQGDPVAAIRELSGGGGAMRGGGVDFAFDCIGVKVTMEQILRAIRGRRPGSRGGTAVLVGIPQGQPELAVRELLMSEKTYTGSLAGSCVPERDYPTFLQWFAEGKLDLDALVTARYPLDEINEATSALEAGKIAGRAILELSG